MDIKKTNGFIIFLLLGIFTSSCINVGNNFPSQTNWITKNKTTQADVRSVLGRPHTVGKSGEALTWSYSFYKYDIFKGNNHKELKFYWNSDRSVKHFHYNSNFPIDIESLGRVYTKK